MHDVNTRLVTHEAVCAERYKNIESRMSRMEYILIGIFATLVCALGAALYMAKFPGS